MSSFHFVFLNRRFLIAGFLAALMLIACGANASPTDEILIGIKVQYLGMLDEPRYLEPSRTGIVSIDSLNEKWNVQEMVPLFPDISPDDKVAARYGLAGLFRLIVPADTNLREMIGDYEADTHIDFVEMNKPVEIK